MFKRLKAEDKEIVQQVFERPLNDDDYVFLSRTGNPIMPGSYTYKFTKILKKYNLPKELTVHSLRHTNASLLIAQNVDIRTVANLLGHAQPSTTLNIYAHAFDSTKRAASERLNILLKM
jgi:integrase